MRAAALSIAARKGYRVSMCTLILLCANSETRTRYDAHVSYVTRVMEAVYTQTLRMLFPPNEHSNLCYIDQWQATEETGANKFLQLCFLMHLDCRNMANNKKKVFDFFLSALCPLAPVLPRSAALGTVLEFAQN